MDSMPGIGNEQKDDYDDNKELRESIIRRTLIRLFNLARNTQKKSLKAVWIPLAVCTLFILLSQAGGLKNTAANAMTLLLGVFLVLYILWYLISWPLHLIDELSDPRGIEEILARTGDYYEKAETEYAKLGRELRPYEIAENENAFTVGGLIYSIKERIFIAILRIGAVFCFLVSIFGCIYRSVDLLCCSNSNFRGISSGESIIKYTYYSLVTFTTVGFGDNCPKGVDPWRYIITAFEISVATAYVLLALTMVASSIFIHYSVRRDHFSAFLRTLSPEAGISKGKTEAEH